MKRNPVKRSRSSVVFVAFPLKQWWQRFSIIFFLTASLGLIVLGRLHNPVTEQLRTRLVDSMSPLITAIAKPLETVQDFGRAINEFLYVHEENLAQEKELTKLRRDALLNKQIACENARLKELLHFVGVRQASFITARVIADTTGPFLRSITINAGSVDGAHKGHAVISEHGLIGRIVEVGNHTSRVLLITDINSRIPIVMEHSRERAMVSGNNAQALDVLYLPLDSKTTNGELAITSGDGKYFPSGLPVGTVNISNKQQPKILPLTDWSRLEYVSVIKQ